MKFASIANTFIASLLRSAEGIKAIEESFIINELHAMFKEIIDETDGFDAFLSVDRLEHTMTLEFFNIIGNILRDVEGIKYLFISRLYY